MKATLSRVVERWWDGEGGVGGRIFDVAATPAEWLWRAASVARRRSVGAGLSIGRPVISVGNVAVGGTGKTPFVGWIVRQLAAAGVAPGVVVHQVAEDEAHLLRSWTPDIPVVVDADRVRGATQAVERGAATVVLDDGFQHHRLLRDLDVVLWAVEDPIPGRVLPRGRLREPLEALRRADAVVITRRGLHDRTRLVADELRDFLGHDAPPVVGSVYLEPGRLESLVSGGDPGEPSPQTSVLACAGIARPSRFFDHVRDRFGSHGEVRFADHHTYDARDARGLRDRAAGRPILITEKDAVKLRPFAEVLGPTWVLLQRLSWAWGEEDTRALVVHAARGRPAS
ncbi:MAG: tetraacyldisaccharide 4'-kinase [Gemmatimonadota bacterium]